MAESVTMNGKKRELMFVCADFREDDAAQWIWSAMLGQRYATKGYAVFKIRYRHATAALSTNRALSIGKAGIRLPVRVCWGRCRA